MPCIIGISVQDDEIVPTTIKDKVHLVAVLLRLLAQNTAAFRGSLYIFYPPWCPKVFHHTYIIC
jgi:hypothetical protein